MIINHNNILHTLVDMTRRDAMLGNSHENLFDNELHPSWNAIYAPVDRAFR